MDPSRILYHYSSTQVDTGSPRALLAMVDLVDRARFEPVYLAGEPGPLPERMAAHKVEVLPGIVASVELSHPVPAAASVWDKLRFLRSQRIRLIHMNELGWNRDLVIAAWLLRIPVVIHLHNPCDIGPRNLETLIASLFITVSHAQKASITGFERIAARHAVLYNCVDIDRFSKGVARRAALGLSPDDLVVTTVAQVCQRKGIDIVLDVARRLLPSMPRLVFVVAGSAGKGEADFNSRIREEAAAPEIGDRIRLLGSRDDIPDILSSSDAFFLPTRAEPFGIAIIEAMAAGLPVVASRVGGIPEILDDVAYGRLVEPDDQVGFAAALAEILSTPDNGRSMGVAGRASLANRFDKATLAGQLEAHYAALLANH